MELQITKQEAAERLKSKFTTPIGAIIMLCGVAMGVCRIIFIFNHNPDLQFNWGSEVIPAIVVGWGVFCAKDSVISGAIGMLMPKKK